MSHYILVHGAWEESGMWDRVSPILQHNGHSVTAIDLPGHGVNNKPDSVVTTQSYIDAVVDVINRLGYPIILVAHSMNGALISHVAERIPEKIERLVYVTAFLLKSGENVFETMQNDPDAEVFPEIQFSDDQSLATLPVPALMWVGLHDVAPSEIERILPMMAEWQATDPFLTKLVLSDEKFGSVPKTYIRTSNDKMISPAQQTAMIANWPVDSVFELDSGHFPTSSVPAELADVLLRASSTEAKQQAGNG